jgi:hypothetical protein
MGSYNCLMKCHKYDCLPGIKEVINNHCTDKEKQNNIHVNSDVLFLAVK